MIFLIKVVIGIVFVLTILNGAGLVLIVGFCGIPKMMGVTDFGDLGWLANHWDWLSVALGLIASASFVAMMYTTEKLAKKVRDELSAS